MNTILETTEADNLGYVYLSVAGDGIAVIERGRGPSVDPTKTIVDDVRRGARS